MAPRCKTHSMVRATYIFLRMVRTYLWAIRLIGQPETSKHTYIRDFITPRHATMNLYTVTGTQPMPMEPLDATNQGSVTLSASQCVRDVR